MIDLVDTLLVLVLLAVLSSLGSSRLPSLIKALAFQGVAVSMVPLFLEHALSAGGLAFTLATMLIRGVAIPMYIYMAIRKVAIRRETDPLIGYHASLLIGLIMTPSKPHTIQGGPISKLDPWYLHPFLFLQASSLLAIDKYTDPFI